MKKIQISIEIPEKKDIIQNMDSFSNSEIQLFVNDFEGIDYKKNWDLVRETKEIKEYYSLITSTVYQIDAGGYYHKIFFLENRPKNIGYGINPDTKHGRAYCLKCMSLICSSPDLVGRLTNYCNCKTAQGMEETS